MKRLHCAQSTLTHTIHKSSNYTGKHELKTVDLVRPELEARLAEARNRLTATSTKRQEDAERLNQLQLRLREEADAITQQIERSLERQVCTT